MEDAPEQPATVPAMPKALAQGITQVMQRVGKLAKEQKNQHGGYTFASIDAFLEAVQPACSEAGVIITQDEDSFSIQDGWLVLRYRFTLATSSGEVWSYQPVRTVMVNAKQGSQAFGAAQSYALKQMMRSLFQIATGDQEDVDHHPHADLPNKQGSGATKPAQNGGNGQAKQAAPTSKRGPYRLYDAAGELVHEFPGTRDGAEQALKHLESYAETEPSTALANLELLQRAAKAQGDFGKRAQQVLDSIQPKEAAE